MPTFKFRIVQTETVQSYETVSVRAVNFTQAMAKIEKQIEDGKIHDDGNWEQCSPNVRFDIEQVM